jgi:hypothetical protein
VVLKMKTETKEFIKYKEDDFTEELNITRYCEFTFNNVRFEKNTISRIEIRHANIESYKEKNVDIFFISVFLGNIRVCWGTIDTNTYVLEKRIENNEITEITLREIKIYELNEVE